MTCQWVRWRLKSPASRLFTQPLIQTRIKENIKAPRHWPLCGEFTGTGEFPAQMASNAENVSIWWRHHVSSVNDDLRPIYAQGICYHDKRQQWYSLHLCRRAHLKFLSRSYHIQHIEDAILQMTFSNAFYWTKMYEFRLRFHWSSSLGV